MSSCTSWREWWSARRAVEEVGRCRRHGLAKSSSGMRGVNFFRCFDTHAEGRVPVFDPETRGNRAQGAGRNQVPEHNGMRGGGEEPRSRPSRAGEVPPRVSLDRRRRATPSGLSAVGDLQVMPLSLCVRRRLVQPPALPATSAARR